MNMTLPSAQFSTFPLFVKDNLRNRPQDFVVTDEAIADIEKQQAVRRAAEEKVYPPKKDSPQAELNKLRSQLFTLQQNAHATEVTVNHEIGNVKLYEQRLGVVLKSKKEYEEAGNFVAARSYEHQAQELENELADARDRLVKNRRYNTGAARELRKWQDENGPRLLELKKEVG